MCQLSYTIYKNCGCACIHETLPCVRAFISTMPKCDHDEFVQGEEVEGDCPECKPAFDNKSGLKARITLNFKRKTPPQRVIMQEAQKVQLKGTFAEIDQQHNQFRHLDWQGHDNHKYQLFLNWLNDPKHAGPRDGNLDEDDRAWCAEKRQIAYASRAGQEDHLGKITPSPPPTPSTTTTQVISVQVRDEYTLRARNHVLTGSQRRVMRRLGYNNICRLSVVSRRHHHHSDDTSSDDASSDDTSSEYAPTVRLTTLSPSQRAVLRRAGHGNIRRLSVISRRLHHHSNDASSDEYTPTARRTTLSPSQRAAVRRSGLGHIRKLAAVGPRRRPQPCY